MYLYEKNEGSISDSAAEQGFDGKKRRGSIAKVASLVGLSKKSNSTSNLSGGKTKIKLLRVIYHHKSTEVMQDKIYIQQTIIIQMETG